MKDRAHSLRSFSAWLNKGYDLRKHAAGRRDARRNPDISPASMFLALLPAFVFRLPSFPQLDSELSHSYLPHWIGAERAFGDDTLRYSLCSFELDPLQAMWVDVNRRFKRGKVFDQGRVQGRLVAAWDGVEVLSSFRRHCETCLERPRQPQGPSRPQDRGNPVLPSGCRLSDDPQSGQALPGRGVAPARREPRGRGPALIAPFAGSVGKPLVRHPGVGCAVCANARVGVGPRKGLGRGDQPQTKLARSGSIGRTPVLRAGRRMRASPRSQSTKPTPCSFGIPKAYPLPSTTHSRYGWSVPNRSWNGIAFARASAPRPCTDHEWLWITTLPNTAFPATVIRQLGHGRWKNENNGWMDLTKHWGAQTWISPCLPAPPPAPQSRGTARTRS